MKFIQNALSLLQPSCLIKYSLKLTLLRFFPLQLTIFEGSMMLEMLQRDLNFHNDFGKLNYFPSASQWLRSKKSFWVKFMRIFLHECNNFECHRLNQNKHPLLMKGRTSLTYKMNASFPSPTDCQGMTVVTTYWIHYHFLAAIKKTLKIYEFRGTSLWHFY